MVPPWYAPTYWPYVDTTHRQSKQHPTKRERMPSDSYFPAGIILARILVEFSMIELSNPLKSVRHYKLPKRQTSRVSYTT